MGEQVFTNLTNNGPVSVYVKDGVVTRIRPLVADEADFRPWVIEADGKKYSPPKKFNVAPMVLAERRRLYSDERIKYPMKRVDFDPNGERNPQNRGKSAYERISLGRGARPRLQRDRARQREVRQFGHQRHDLVPPQLGHRRLQDGAVHALHELPRGHARLRQPGQLGGVALGRHPHLRLLLASGHARAVRQPPGRAQERRDDRLVVQRPGLHPRHLLRPGVGHLAHLAQGEGRRVRLHRPLLQLHQRASSRTRSGSRRAWAADTALAMAIAYVWITEDTYDKQYVDDRTIGFDEFGSPTCSARPTASPRRPEWAAEECGVKARVIRTLAREWASKTHRALAAGARGGEGGACRDAYGTEWARMMVLLQAMQGLGQAGREHRRHQHGRTVRLRDLVPGLRRPGGPHGPLDEAAKTTSRSTRSSSGCTG